MNWIDSLFFYFSDPVLRAPTIACILICLAASLVGVIVFLKRQSLLGESLSHASYPGVIAAMFLCSSFLSSEILEKWIAVFVIGGAFISACLGLFLIDFMKKYLKVRNDSALCFVLSVFFGIGVTLASHLQFTHASLYNRAQVYLYGQAATMVDAHVYFYSFLSLSIILLISLFYKELLAINFDKEFAMTIGIRTQLVEVLFFFLLVLSVIIGIRSVGVVLMSAMLIAPATAARQFTNRLYLMFLLSGCFGILSGFLGVYLSVEWGESLERAYPGWSFSLPTGPLIVLVAVSICIFSLLFAPERGVFLRFLRIAAFRYKCLQENLLKTIWRFDEGQGLNLQQLAKLQSASRWLVFLVIFRLSKQGWVYPFNQRRYCLTEDGRQRAAHIVRLHRLWEAYLVSHLGFGIERVHKSAEEMEHIITPELEKKLTELLRDPKKDPHSQPIPPKDMTMA